ncbi:MAG: hypothetical protein ACM3ZV_03840 [Bacillota bacterium]
MTHRLPSAQIIRSTSKSAAPAAWLPMLVSVACVATAIPANAEAPGLQLVYQATFPNGTFQASPDLLRVGPVVTGDSQIADSDPTFARLPGELFLSITRPVGLSPSSVVAEGAVATPVNFGPGSISRVSATFRAPVGPLATGGWAVTVSARTGGQYDLNSETRVAATLNVRPGGVLRLNVPFGAAVPTNVTLPTAIRDKVFSAVAPVPFTLELTIDRTTGTGQAALTVENSVFPLSFTLSDFVASGGPMISAMEAGVANANAPGQTVSVRLRNMQIYSRMVR